MKTLVTIRQASFAKYIMVDILYALRANGIETDWIDLEQVVYNVRNASKEEKQSAVEEAMAKLTSPEYHFITSYGIEYFCNTFETLSIGIDAPLYTIIKKPAVNFFFDFGKPFDPRPETDAEFALVQVMNKPDYLFYCWDQIALKKLLNLEMNRSFYFPMAVNPDAFPDSKSFTERSANIIFAGGPTPDRITHLKMVSDLGLSVFGYKEDEWHAGGLGDCWNEPVKKREVLAKVYGDSKIAINITRAHGESSLNMRVYEAMAAGCVMLTDDKGDARELFKEDEIVTYTTLEDLREKTQFLLNNPELAISIAQKGRQRVLAEHTYLNRIKDIMPQIIQWYREHRLFERAGQFALNDQAKALQFLEYAIGKVTTIELNVDILDKIRAGETLSS